MELTKELTKDKQPLSSHSKVNKRAYLKYGSLIMLVFQNSALSITMRMARTQKELFISSTAVIMGELLKLITCLAMIRIDEGRQSKFSRTIKPNFESLASLLTDNWFSFPLQVRTRSSSGS